MAPGWKSVNKRAPCLACGGTDRCSWNGETLHCFRAKEPPPGMRFVCISPADARGAMFVGEAHDQGGNGRVPHADGAAAPVDRDKAQAAARARLTAALRSELARRLGVKEASLQALELGWVEGRSLKQLRAGFARDGEYPRGCFTVPERSGETREIVGWSLRTREGRKGAPSTSVGCRRGIVVPSDFDRRLGPVLVVEGASDVAAAHSLELRAVGRPSNSSGVNDLAALLAREARVIILGENDEKANGDHPGRSGMDSVASGVATAIRRPVRAALPPTGFKDLRVWLQARVVAGLNLDDSAACKAVGQELLRAIEQNASVVAPRAVKAWKPMPIDSFPEPLASWIRATARAINVDPALLGLLKLGTTAALIGNSRRLRLTPAWAVSSILWVAALMESGSRKSAALREATFTLNELDQELRERSAKARANWNGATAGDEPTERLCVLRDCTIEAAISRSVANPRGLLYASAELAGLFRSLDMYRAGGKGNDRQRLLAMYDGDPNSRDLVNSSLFVRRCSLSVAGVSTEAAFVRSLGKEAEQDGALARFLVTMPPAVRALSFTALRHAPKPSSTRVRRVERKLAALQLGPDEEPVDLDLTESGSQAFGQFYDTMQERIGATQGRLRAHLEKLVEACARIALGFHYWKQLAESSVNPDVGVDGSTIETAATLTFWFADEGERVYSTLLGHELAESGDERDRRGLLAWIERQPDRRTTAAHLRSNGPFRYKAAEVAEKALIELVSLGYGVWREIQPGPRGGRPSRAFHLCEPADERTETQQPASEPMNVGVSGLAGDRTEPAENTRVTDEQPAP